MDWLQSITLKTGDERRFETPWCTISVRVKEGSVNYQHPPLEVNDVTSTIVPPTQSGEPVERKVMMESLGKKCDFSFLPQYPDRPVVFKINDDVSIPPGSHGFFCVSLVIGMGVGIPKEDYVFEQVRPAPWKNSYWGPPDDGVLTYQCESEAHLDPEELMKKTGVEVAVVPVFYKNQRIEGDALNRCLIPLQELDLYESEDGDLVFEVVELRHKEEFYQEPKPIKRPPKELQKELSQLRSAPNSSQSLFETVRSLPRLDAFTKVFSGR